jgi:hypothetical protein
MKVKKFSIAIFIFLVIYANLWSIALRSPFDSETITVASNIVLQKIKLPLLPALTFPNLKPIADLFDMYSVFAYYETINRETVIQGLPRGASPDGDEWIDLNIVDEYCPHYQGEQHMRIYLSKHYMQGSEFHKNAYKAFAAKIRNKYNREHPDKPIQKIAVGFLTWPRSTEGYWKLKQPETELFQLLYMED